MKNKDFLKKYYIPIAGLILLILFGVIGQMIHKDMPDMQDVKDAYSTDGMDTKEIDDQEANELVNQTYDIYSNIQVIGDEITDDNPWGKTAGIFEMEDLGKCIFLTPNTGFELNDTYEYNGCINFQVKIHPWVATLSDGAGLKVWLLDGDDTILFEDNVIVKAKDEWLPLSYNFDLYENTSKILVQCNNGLNGEDSADWIIVKFEI